MTAISKVRLYIDSVIDRNRLRILISTENHIEEAYILTRSTLRRLLSLKRIPRYAESLVFHFEVPNVQRLLKSLKEKDKTTLDVHTLGIKNVEDITVKERVRLRQIQSKLRTKMKDRRI